MAYVQYLACEMHSTVDNCCLLQSYCNYYWPYKASGIVLKDRLPLYPQGSVRAAIHLQVVKII